MSNLTSLRGSCPAPFFDEASFPRHGGYVLGRYCAQSDLIERGLRCCLPCPATDLTYPDDFYSLSRLAGPINLAAFGLCAFMLLSFAVLPVETTRRHFLNICIIACIMLLQLGFIVPWAAEPTQCYDAITPNDMSTSMICAWSGAFVIFGAISTVSWVLLRSLSMHILICWDIHPGKTFFWASNAFAWAVSILVAAMELTYTGVSFRFGDYCHVNHNNSLQSFWVWILLLSAIALFLQVATCAYCIYIYMRASTRITHAPQMSTSTTSATRSQTFLNLYRRLRKVLALQWRGLVFSALVVANAIYFAISFITIDRQTVSGFSDQNRILPWVFCIVESQNKNKCLPLVEDVMVNEWRLIATLIVLAVIGIEAFLLICRWQMMIGWLQLLGIMKKNDPEWINVQTGNASTVTTRKRPPKGYELDRITKQEALVDEYLDEERDGRLGATAISHGSPHSFVGTSQLQAPESAFRSPQQQDSRGSMEPFFGNRDDQRVGSGVHGYTEESWRPMTRGSDDGDDSTVQPPLRTFWSPGQR